MVTGGRHCIGVLMVHLLGRSQHCKQPKGRLDQTLAGFTHAPRCSQAFYLFNLQFVPVFNRSFFGHILMMLSFVVKFIWNCNMINCRSQSWPSQQQSPVPAVSPQPVMIIR